MKFIYSVSNWIYGEEPFEIQFKRLNKYGYDAIEIMIKDPSNFNITEIKNLLTKYSLKCSSICGYVEGAVEKAKRRNLIDSDPDVRKKTIKYLKRCLEIGKELDAKLVLAAPSGVANTTDEWNAKNIELCVRAMQELGDFAKSLDSIYLVIEPINRYENAFLRRCDQALKLLKKANHSHVRMMLDFFHTNIEENNNGDAIRLASNYLIHCHIADSNRKSVGRGQTDWFEIYRALRDIEFEGCLACEPLPPSGPNVYVNLKGNRNEADLYTKECIEILRFIESVICIKNKEN